MEVRREDSPQTIMEGVRGGWVLEEVNPPTADRGWRQGGRGLGERVRGMGTLRGEPGKVGGRGFCRGRRSPRRRKRAGDVRVFLLFGWALTRQWGLTAWEGNGPGERVPSSRPSVVRKTGGGEGYWACCNGPQSASEEERAWRGAEAGGPRVLTGAGSGGPGFGDGGWRVDRGGSGEGGEEGEGRAWASRVEGRGFLGGGSGGAEGSSKLVLIDGGPRGGRGVVEGGSVKVGKA